MRGIRDVGAPANFTSTLYQQRAHRLRASAEWSAVVRPVVDTARRRGWAARCRLGQCNECLAHARARAEYARRGPGDQRCDMQFVVAWARCSIALATSVSQLGLGVSLHANASICVRSLSLLLEVHGGCSEWGLGWHKLRPVVFYVGPRWLAMVLCNVCSLWSVVPGLIFPSCCDLPGASASQPMSKKPSRVGPVRISTCSFNALHRCRTAIVMLDIIFG